MKRALIWLGPPGIKIGQVLCHRSDLFPHEVCDEFAILTDSVPGMNKKEEEAILKSAKNVVKYIGEPIKLGSGCIAVSYLVKTNETFMVMKIKRPNIDEDMRRSLEYITCVVYLISKISGIDFSSKFDKMKESLTEQTDFCREIDEIEYFRKYYVNDNNIKIPEVYRDKSNENVITMEYLHGRCMNELSKIEKENASKILFDFVFESSFVAGHWHSDLHKGNIVFMENKLGIIDFGLTGILKGYEKSIILNYNTHLFKKEWKSAARIFVSKMTNKMAKDKDTFTKDVCDILEEHFNKEKVDIASSVKSLSSCSKKHGSKFNDKYVKFELAFATFACTMVELGHENIFSLLKKRILHRA